MKNKNNVKSVKALFPGQEVAVANCRDNATVISRLEKIGGQRVYLVNYQGKEIRVSRNLLGVRVNGMFKFGAYSTTDL
jgi:hypothetical protein